MAFNRNSAGYLNGNGRTNGTPHGSGAGCGTNNGNQRDGSGYGGGEPYYSPDSLESSEDFTRGCYNGRGNAAGSGINQDI